MSEHDKDQHWLVRPETIRRLWIGFAIVLAATVLIEFVIPVKGYFGVDDVFGFGALFGFFSCVAMVIFAKLLGFFIKRDENYYRKEAQDD